MPSHDMPTQPRPWPKVFRQVGLRCELHPLGPRPPSFTLTLTWLAASHSQKAGIRSRRAGPHLVLHGVNLSLQPLDGAVQLRNLIPGVPEVVSMPPGLCLEGLKLKGREHSDGRVGHRCQPPGPSLHPQEASPSLHSQERPQPPLPPKPPHSQSQKAVSVPS